MTPGLALLLLVPFLVIVTLIVIGMLKVSRQADDADEQIARQIAEGAAAIPSCRPGCTCRGHFNTQGD